VTADDRLIDPFQTAQERSAIFIRIAEVRDLPPPGPPAPPRPRRFYGTVTLDPARAGRDASKITDEVITHLVGLIGSSVRVTLEIDAEIPTGVPDNVVRTVTENSRTLKFTSHGFETE
jgi:hypothetical protein